MYFNIIVFHCTKRKQKGIVWVSDFLAVEEDPADAEPKFNPFTGSGRRLDGKPLKYEPAPASSSGSKDKKPAVTNGNAQPSTGSSSQATSCQARGKLVFGSNASRSPKETKKVLLLLLFHDFHQLTLELYYRRCQFVVMLIINHSWFIQFCRKLQKRLRKRSSFCCYLFI